MVSLLYEKKFETHLLYKKKILVLGATGRIGKAVCKAVKDHGGIVLRAGVDGEEYRIDVMDLDNYENNLFLNCLVDCTYPPDYYSLKMGYANEFAGFCSSQLIEGGSIVLLSSIYGMNGPRNLYDNVSMVLPTPAYAFWKSGVIGLTKYLATKLACYGIRCNCVSPGGIQDYQPEEFIKRYEANTPLGRMAKSEDVANAIVFLLSDMSNYITGINLPVDGGWSAW